MRSRLFTRARGWRARLVTATGALAGLVAALAAGCSAAPDRVVVGVALNSITHPAVQLAIDEINAAGGIDGVPLEAMGLDWNTGPADAGEIVDWAHRFSEEPDLLGVIGHSDSAATLTSAAVYNRLEIPQLVTIATNPAITDIGPWTYRLCISDAHQGPALAEYAVRELGHRRLALFYVNDEYGKGLASEFRSRAESLGAEIVRSTLHRNLLDEAGRQRIRTILEELSALPPGDRPDLFVLFQRTQAGLWTVRTIRDVGLRTPLLGGDNFALERFTRQPLPAAEGLRAASFYVEPADTPRGRAFQSTFRERLGREPDYGDAFAYDAVHLLRDAVAERGFSRTAVKEYLDLLVREGRPVHGVTGTFVLGPDHDARRDFYIVELREGRFVPVETISTR